MMLFSKAPSSHPRKPTNVPPQKKDHFERKGSSSSPTTFQGTKPIWDDDPFFWEAVIPPPNWSTTTTTFVGHFGIRGHPQNPNTVQKMRVRISAVLLPQKLTWQWKIIIFDRRFMFLHGYSRFFSLSSLCFPGPMEFFCCVACVLVLQIGAFIMIFPALVPVLPRGNASVVEPM